MAIERRFTKSDADVYEGLNFGGRRSEIRNPDGSVVFLAEDVMVPETWSQVATDIMAQKYFRKAGVPAALKRVEEEGIPEWLQRCVADEEALAKLRDVLLPKLISGELRIPQAEKMVEEAVA